MIGMDTEVLIVGAGPVGLTLSIDLGKRGILHFHKTGDHGGKRKSRDMFARMSDTRSSPAPRTM